MPAVLNVNTNERIITGTPSIYILGNQCQKLELLDKNPWRNKLSTLGTFDSIFPIVGYIYSFQLILINAIHHNNTTNSEKLNVLLESAQDKGQRDQKSRFTSTGFGGYCCIYVPPAWIHIGWSLRHGWTHRRVEPPSVQSFWCRILAAASEKG